MSTEAKPGAAAAQAGRELEAGGRALTSQPSAKPDHAGPSGPKTSPPSSLRTLQRWLPDPPCWHLLLTSSQSAAGHRVRAVLEGAQTDLGKALGREQRQEGWGAGDSKPTSSRGVRRRGQASGHDTLWPHQHWMWASDEPPSAHRLRRPHLPAGTWFMPTIHTEAGPAPL